MMAESESNLLVTQGGPADSYILSPCERRPDFPPTHTRSGKMVNKEGRSSPWAPLSKLAGGGETKNLIRTVNTVIESVNTQAVMESVGFHCSFFFSAK